MPHKTTANDHYEPKYRELSKKYSKLQRDYRKLEREHAALKETFDRRVGELEAKLDEVIDANKKLRDLLFVRNQPKTRTQRPKVTVVRTPESYRRPQPEPEQITDRKSLVITACPDCDTPVTSPIASRTRITEDIILNPTPQITKWTINRYWCRGCHKQVEGTVPGILPKSILGPNVLTVTIIARYRWNLPYAKICDHLKLSYGLGVSEGEIAHLLTTAAELVGPKWAEITQAVKASRSVHCDETGWYVDGQKAWTHVFATEQVVLYEIAGTRGKGVAENALGSDFTGVRISDCLGNYKNLPGKHQICWAHLTREAYENLERGSDNPERQKIATSLNHIYASLRDVTGQANWNPGLAAGARVSCEKQLAALVKRTWHDPPSRKLVNRLQDFHSALFTCLEEPGVAPDNNAAERALRKIVVQRKISGGNRSPSHALIQAKLMSVVETLRLEEGSFVENLQDIFTAGITEKLSRR